MSQLCNKHRVAFTQGMMHNPDAVYPRDPLANDWIGQRGVLVDVDDSNDDEASFDELEVPYLVCLDELCIGTICIGLG